jgi:hypothetical protein
MEGKQNGRYAYVAPYYGQAKQVAWDYLKASTRGLGVKVSETELRVDFMHGARIRLYGADNPDAMRGIYLDGVVMDEMADMRPNVWSQIISPTLADRAGWAVFIGTPKGRNEFCEIYETAKRDPEWLSIMLKASETGILPPEELARQRTLMSEDEYAQEYECSFEAAIKGAYYGRLMTQAEGEGRITRVPHDPSVQVETWWDLGVGDSTAIWFVQRVNMEIRLIDYYEATGEGLPHYVTMLSRKPYVYSRHIAPHDIAVRELGTGKSRREMASALGLEFDVAPMLPVADGIEAVRMMLPRCWFDAEKCAPGIEAVKQYRADYNDKMRDFKDKPMHDWTSHGCDALRYGAVMAAPIKSAPIRYHALPIV